MLIFSALILFAIIFCLNIAAFVLLLPLMAAAAVLFAVNAAGISCGMKSAPVLWDIITVLTAFKTVSLLSTNIFLSAAVTADLCRLFICYLLCSVAMVIWWMVRESELRHCFRFGGLK